MIRYEPRSPTCANWLRCGMEPKDLSEGMQPGYGKGKARRADNLGYAGRRVLVPQMVGQDHSRPIAATERR
jgi:hypothetical protein